MLSMQKCTQRLAAGPGIARLSCQQVPKGARMHSDAKSDTQAKQDEVVDAQAKPTEEARPKKKTQAELDQELLVKLQGLDGDGGSAGVEYEDGKPVSMKRSVRNNMFRYI
ncbi:hypothetical protein NX059_006719 [Plenodomus lindquistii]|nr:hypothetical protein NX059_006719 [Plenodomus lindquistii]